MEIIHAPEVNEILSKRTPPFYKIGVFIILLLLVGLIPFIPKILKSNDLIKITSLNLRIVITSDSLLLYSLKDYPPQITKYYNRDTIIFSELFLSNNSYALFKINDRILFCDSIFQKEIGLICDFNSDEIVHKQIKKDDEIVLSSEWGNIPLKTIEIKEKEQVVSIWAELAPLKSQKYLCIPATLSQVRLHISR